jgi:hypothetical protein
MLGKGNGTFAPPDFPGVIPVDNDPVSVTAGDVNADGKLDLVTANNSSNTVSVLLGNGNGTFATQKKFPVGAAPVSVNLGDVNRDGKLDLVVANQDSNSVSLLIGKGNGAFAAQQTFATGSSPSSVTLGTSTAMADLILRSQIPAAIRRVCC